MLYILVLSLILRIVLINQSLWLDESIEALALMGRMGPLLSYALSDYQPPLYHLIGYLTTQLFGYSEFVLRLPSLVSGVFTVYFVVKIGELLASKRVGIIAGLLAATNPLLIYYSQEGRTYAMTCFFVTASFYYFLQLLKNKQTSKLTTISYFLFTTAFLWTSYLSWFVLLAQGIYSLAKKRYDIVLIQSISSLSLLAWLPSFISSLGIGQSTLTGSPEWGKVVGGLTWKSLPLTWVKFVLGRISFDSRIVYGVITLFIGLIHFIVIKKVDIKRYLILLLWIIPPLVLGLFTASILPVYSYFRVLFILPAYLLLLSLGIAKYKSNLLLGLIIFAQLSALTFFWLSPRFHREDWRRLVSDIPSHAVVAMPSLAQNAPLLYYGWDKPIIEPNKDVLQGNTIYYVRYVEDLFDTKKLGQANFERSGYTISSQRTYPGIAVDLYTK